MLERILAGIDKEEMKVQGMNRMILEGLMLPIVRVPGRAEDPHRFRTLPRSRNGHAAMFVECCNFGNSPGVCYCPRPSGNKPVRLKVYTNSTP